MTRHALRVQNGRDVPREGGLVSRRGDAAAQKKRSQDERRRGNDAHLTDPVAYRRDRRKDQVLQEKGYLVLRFLAEDVCKELDLTNPAI